MGYESSGCDAIISGLGLIRYKEAKVQRDKGFVEAHCSASPQSLVNLISQRRRVCHFDPETSGEKSPQEARQRLDSRCGVACEDFSPEASGSK
jgi:hypothetical protein